MPLFISPMSCSPISVDVVELCNEPLAVLDVDSVGRRDEAPRWIMVWFDRSSTPGLEVAEPGVSGLSGLVAGEDTKAALRACKYAP